MGSFEVTGADQFKVCEFSLIVFLYRDLGQFSPVVMDVSARKNSQKGLRNPSEVGLLSTALSNETPGKGKAASHMFGHLLQH